MAFGVGDVVVCRCKLRHHGHELQRGDMGIVVRAGPNDRYLCKWDEDERCVDGCWLEPHPGTFSLGFNGILARPRQFYSLGPLVSVLIFPKQHEAARNRFWEHYQALTRSGFGFSFYDGINAKNIVGSMLTRYGHDHCNVLVNPEQVGSIVCEHPWLRGPGDRIKFLAELAREFLSQLSTIPKILIMRVSEWENIAQQFTGVRRIQVLFADSGEFRLHYTPVRQDWSVMEPDEIHASGCAIIFHPNAGSSSRF